MSNVRYLNQQSPFWDWVSQLELSGPNHPFLGAYNPEVRNNSRDAPTHEAPPPPHHEGPPPSASQGDAPPPPNSHNPRHGPSHETPFSYGFPFGGHHGGPHHRGGPHGHHGNRGPWGGRRGGGRCGTGFGDWPMGGGNNFDMSKIAEFVSQFIPEEVMAGAREGFATKDSSKDTKDFTPPADIFDTEDAYIVHVSLPGAKKEDVGVNWDADKSELNIAGVIYRPGDEDFLKTLALDERKVGVFERKVKLGSRTNPAQVDLDAISAKMEDGILMVTIPKLDNDIVDVKKVDIE